MDHRPAPHAPAVAGEASRLAHHTLLARPREAHRADRLRAAAAAGTGDAGDRQRDAALAAGECAARHLARGFLAYCAMIFQDFFSDAQELLLGRVRIRYE